MSFNFNELFAKVGEVITFRAKGTSAKTMPIYARVLNREFKGYRRWNMGAIAAGASSVFTEIRRAATGGYYLQPDAQDYAGHYYVGVYPNHCRVNWQYPLGTKLGTLLELSAIGDAAGAIPGDWIPYDNPSPILEFLTLSDVFPPAFAITNDSKDTETYLFNFVGCWYHVDWLDYNRNEEHKAIINQAAALGLIRFIPFGGLTPCSIPTWLRE